MHKHDRQRGSLQGLGMLWRLMLTALVVSLASTETHAGWTAISEEDAKLVFYGPGLESALVTREMKAFAVGTFEYAGWRTFSKPFAIAELLYMGGGPQTFIRMRRIKQLLDDFIYFENRKLNFHDEGTVKNILGKITYRKFTADDLECVGFSQKIKRALAYVDRAIYGYYCVGPNTSLPQNTIEAVLQGIGVKDIKVPSRQNYTEATKWFRKAADQGHAQALEMISLAPPELSPKSLSAIKRIMIGRRGHFGRS